MSTNKFSAIIMAAGKGTRMKSDLPKVLHKVCGKSMLDHVIDTVSELNPEKIFVIVGHEAEKVKASFDNRLDITWVEQKEQLGTGHAVMQIVPFLDNYNGNVLILSGDVPLITKDTISNLISFQYQNNLNATIMTTLLENPFGYGRILKNELEEVIGIIEEKDSNEEQKLIKEINSGTYCFNWNHLESALKQITPQNAQGEYYLTDVIKIFSSNNLKMKTFCTKNIEEVLGVNDRVALSEMSKILRKKINTKHQVNGVTIIDPDNTYIDSDVIIGRDSIIYPNVLIEGKSIIGEGCIIGHNSSISDSQVGNNSKIVNSHISNSKIYNNCEIGPFARIREKAVINDKVKIGNFVEIKKSILSEGVKASHLSYLGDAEIGSSSNIGAGTITCNYDGKKKHKTLIGSNAFIGSNSTLVAPVNIENDSYVGAGSVITHTVPQYSLSLGRSKQIIKEDWVLKKREMQNG